MLKRKKYNSLDKPSEYWQHTANVSLDTAIYFIFISLAAYFVMLMAPGMKILGDMIAGAWILLVVQIVLSAVIFIRKRVSEIRQEQSQQTTSAEDTQD